MRAPTLPLSKPTTYTICLPQEADIAELLTLITTPIPGDNPMGANINYEPDFDVLKTEVGKLGGVDYDLIDEKSRALLTNKSKDLRVMGFLSLSLLRKDAWEELADLFAGMTQLAEQGFDSMFPERPRAREQALRWLSETRYNELLAEKKPEEQHYDHMVRLCEALTKFKALLEPKYPEGSPFPSNLLKTAQGWEKACKPQPKTQAAASGGAPGGASGATPAELMETPKQAQAAIRRPARFLEEKEPQKIMGFRLMRSVRWDILEALPPAEGGKTQLPGPNPQQRQFFEATLAQKDWKTLHEKAEEVFVGGACHLWLDLQRYSITACKEMGAPYAALTKSLTVELALFVGRLPGVLELSFADGSLFCDAATKAWIQSDVAAALSSGAPPTAASGGAGDELEVEAREINGLAAGGQIEKALGMLQTAIRGSSSEEHYFKRSILLGQLLLRAKQPDIALSIYETLDDKVDTYHLDKWNPDLATDAWTGLIQAIKVARPQKPQNIQVTLTDKHNTILKKISQINPMKAFELNK